MLVLACDGWMLQWPSGLGLTHATCAGTGVQPRTGVKAPSALLVLSQGLTHKHGFNNGFKYS